MSLLQADRIDDRMSLDEDPMRCRSVTALGLGSYLSGLSEARQKIMSDQEH